MRLAFFGSDDFSVTFFKNLIKSPFSKILIHSSHREGAGGPLITYVKDKFESKYCTTFEALVGFDLAISASFGLYIPKRVVKSVPFFFNIHPSVLPRFRGASPIQRSIMEGDSTTGITIIDMEGDGTFDSGNIWHQEIIPQDPLKVNFKEMENLLAIKAANAMNEIINNNFQTLSPIAQSGKITYAPKLTIKDYEILFKFHTRRDILLKYNALSYQRSLFTTFLKDERKIHLVEISFSSLLTKKEGILPGNVYIDKRLGLIWIMCNGGEWLGVKSFRIEGKSSLFDWGNCRMALELESFNKYFL